MLALDSNKQELIQIWRAEYTASLALVQSVKWYFQNDSEVRQGWDAWKGRGKLTCGHDEIRNLPQCS